MRSVIGRTTYFSSPSSRKQRRSETLVFSTSGETFTSSFSYYQLDRAGTITPLLKAQPGSSFRRFAGRLVATLGDERIGAPKTSGEPAGLLGSARLEPGEDGENGRHYQKRDTKQDED